MFAVKFCNNNQPNWTYCTVNNKPKLFESKESAEAFAELCRKATKSMQLGHVYEVEEVEM